MTNAPARKSINWLAVVGAFAAVACIIALTGTEHSSVVPEETALQSGPMPGDDIIPADEDMMVSEPSAAEIALTQIAEDHGGLNAAAAAISSAESAMDNAVNEVDSE